MELIFCLHFIFTITINIFKGGIYMKITYKDFLQCIFCRKHYLSQLCDEYCNPGDVGIHLQEVAHKYPFTASFLKKDITDLLSLEKQRQADYEEAVLEKQALEEAHAANPCYDCPSGNGEGGCTIGYCEVKIFD